MPYIDSTPRDYPIKFEEDNLIDMLGQLLIDNGWTLAKSFYKAAVDTRAYFRITDRVNYAVAQHNIFRNADGKLLGIATVAQFPVYFMDVYEQVVRRPGDDKDPEDPNYQMTPTWEEWILKKYTENVSNTNIYLYMLEKLPNENLVKNGDIVSIVTMPGMGGTSYNVERDRDRKHWHYYWYGWKPIYLDYEEDDSDLQFQGKIYSASPFHLIRSVLDIEVIETKWVGTSPPTADVIITKTDPYVMQSPIVKVTLRAEFLEHKEHPVWHTNWWTDSEVLVRGHVDSRTFFLILQADNVPTWENNLIPTIPIYFGRVLPLEGSDDEGYALFAGTIPPVARVNATSRLTTYAKHEITPSTTMINVGDASKLPEPPAFLSIGGKEIVLMTEKQGNTIVVKRGQEGTEPQRFYAGTTIARLSTNNPNIPNEIVVSLFDFDDPGATVGETIFPLLKLYPHYASNGVDSVMMSRSRFGARYQSYYLSWGAPTNSLPPARIGPGSKKYPRAYEGLLNTTNYKYQFNTSRYSGKVHSTPVYVVHPEEGVRGYLDKVIGFNPQSINATNLRVRKQSCPERVYEIYKYFSIGAVSPLTKKPATVFRPIGIGVYSHDYNPDAPEYDPTTDNTPPSEVIIVQVVSPQSQTIDVYFKVPDEDDFAYVNIYVDGSLYAKGVSGVERYRILGLRTGFTPEIRITTVDKAGNESAGVIAPPVVVR